SPVPLDLTDQLQQGLFPVPSQLYVTIVDRYGEVVTSTLAGSHVSILDRDYFREHHSGATKGLLISKPEVGRRFGKKVVRFTRGLETADGAFDGIVIVGVDPVYLSALTGEAALSSADFASLKDRD